MNIIKKALRYICTKFFAYNSGGVIKANRDYLVPEYGSKILTKNNLPQGIDGHELLKISKKLKKLESLALIALESPNLSNESNLRRYVKYMAASGFLSVCEKIISNRTR